MARRDDDLEIFACFPTTIDGWIACARDRMQEPERSVYLAVFKGVKAGEIAQDAMCAEIDRRLAAEPVTRKT